MQRQVFAGAFVLACTACGPRTGADPAAADVASTPEPEAKPAPAEAPPVDEQPPAQPAPEAVEPALPEPLRAPDGTSMKRCPESVPEGMACIPGGPYLRGTDAEANPNAHPQQETWISTFLMDVNEVTYAEYKACEKDGGCNKAGPQYLDFDRPEQPINGINWFDAKKYCEVNGKRLPTESEWEKAARGTDGRTYPWGEEEATCERAIIKGVEEGRGCGLKKTKGKRPETGRPWPVGSRPPNQFGLYDMAGNSWEWVQDWYTRSYEECGDACTGLDPKGPCDGGDECPGFRRKIVRGGSWYWPADHAVTYYRRSHVPNNEPFHHFGFRCAASLEQGKSL